MKVRFEADFPESMRILFNNLADNPGVQGFKDDLVDAFDTSDNFTILSVVVDAD